MQIAVTIDDAEVAALDQLVPGRYRSRAEVVRVAVAQFLTRHRSELIGEQCERAYTEQQTTREELEWAAAGEDTWDDLEW
jgi:Arc/MetJ-type ribon-helix-helix transcriptional regulator